MFDSLAGSTKTRLSVWLECPLLLPPCPKAPRKPKPGFRFDFPGSPSQFRMNITSASPERERRRPPKLAMSGHSKWSKVKHFKGALDAKRGKVFSKLSREITVASKAGGGDPTLNARLRMVLLKAKQANMPADTIERAVKKGTGNEHGTDFEDLTYEIYGPSGVAIMVEASTDNKNRTAAEIRHILSKNDGSIATSGSVSRLFRRVGQIVVAQDNSEEDTLMEVALNAGAEDFRTVPDGYEIITEPACFETVHQTVEQAGIPCLAAGIVCMPDSHVPVTPESANRVTRLLELLDSHDDVKDIWTNAEPSRN